MPPFPRADVPPADKAQEAGSADSRCLIRATGGKQRISAMVSVKEYRRFMQSYGNILKVSLDSLKKREKKKAEKAASSTKLLKAGGGSRKGGPAT